MPVGHRAYVTAEARLFFEPMLWCRGLEKVYLVELDDEEESDLHATSAALLGPAAKALGLI
jgi:hypothetical protein